MNTSFMYPHNKTSDPAMLDDLGGQVYDGMGRCGPACPFQPLWCRRFHRFFFSLKKVHKPLLLKQHEHVKRFICVNLAPTQQLIQLYESLRGPKYGHYGVFTLRLHRQWLHF